MTALQPGYGGVAQFLEEQGIPMTPELQRVFMAVGNAQMATGKRDVSIEDINKISGGENASLNPRAQLSAVDTAREMNKELSQEGGWAGLQGGLEDSAEYLRDLKGLAEGTGEDIAQMASFLAALDSTEMGKFYTLGSQVLDMFLGGDGSIGNSGDTNGGGASEGIWHTTDDKQVNIHRGEMVLPARIAESVRKDLMTGGRPPEGLRMTPGEVQSTGEISSRTSGEPSVSVSVPITVNLNGASEKDAVELANRIKDILERETHMRVLGAGG
jgi:hypothetical protein